MTFPFLDDTDTIIPQPAQRLPELRHALARVAPARLSEFFEEMQRAFTEVGEQETVTPIRMFHRTWLSVRSTIPTPTPESKRSGPPARSSGLLIERPRVSDWHWEHDPENLPGGLPDKALDAVPALASELAVRESMIHLEGASFSATMPGRRAEQ